MSNAADPRFPVGPYRRPDPISAADRERYLETLAALPARMREAVNGLSEEQLDTPYRHGGWTVRQVVHHVPDSHLNSYVRFKLALTEANPVIKPYDEAAWAELPDSSAPVDVSLTMLDALHARWVVLLRRLSENDWARTFRHPERGLMPLDETLAMYAWHCEHHVAHITALRRLRGW